MKPLIQQAEQIINDFKYELIEEIDKRIEEILLSYNMDDPKDKERFIDTWYSWSAKDRERVKEYLATLKSNKPNLYHPVWDELI